MKHGQSFTVFEHITVFNLTPLQHKIKFVIINLTRLSVKILKKMTGPNAKNALKNSIL